MKEGKFVKERNITGVWMLVIGVIFLFLKVSNINILIFVSRYWPVGLIILGTIIITTNNMRGIKLKEPDLNIQKVNYFNIFTEMINRVETENFKGGELTTIFGISELDIKSSKIDSSNFLSIVSIFGGVKLQLPKECKVIITGKPIFGSWKNRRHSEIDQDYPVIKIKAKVIFGHIEII